MNISETQILQIIHNALNEDVGDGDITTNSTVDVDTQLNGSIISKEDGIIAGIEVAKLTLESLDKKIKFHQFFKDGEPVKSKNRIFEVSGNGRALLSSERVILNLMQRMSGIATLTRRFVDKVEGTKAKILDTRKTMPGLRVFDKWAVKLGGGQNHRFGLYDMALIKENHITAAGGISESVKKVRSNISNGKLIEVEVKNLDELTETISLKVDRILLDNMSITEMKDAVRIAAGKIPLEASGNVDLNNVSYIAETGVDFISIGMLTHSAKALDLSLIIN